MFEDAPSRDQEMAQEIWSDLEAAWNDPETLRTTAEALRADNRINLLSTPQQHALILRLVEHLEDGIAKDEAGYSEIIAVDNALSPSVRDQNQADIVDVYAGMMKTLWEKYPRATQEISGLLDQNAQIVNTDVWLTSLSDIVTAPNLPAQAKHRAHEGLSYQISCNNLLPAISKRIRALENNSAAEAMTTLTLLEAAAKYGNQFSFSAQSSHELQALIGDYAHTDTPALLRRKAASLLTRETTNLQATEHSTATIPDRRFINAVILPISRDHLGVYSSTGRLHGLLPKHHANTYLPHEIIQPSSLQILDTTRAQSEQEQTRRETAQHDYAMFLDYPVLKIIEADYGFPVTELTTREQLWFVASLRQYRKKEEATVQAFTKKFGLDGARAFLATEFGDTFRATILHIAEQLPEATARNVFRQFGDIVTLAQTTAEELGKQFFAHDTQYDASAVRNELLSRAKELLIVAQHTDPKNIAEKLARFQGDIVLFASMFKVTQKGRPLRFEDIRGLHLASLSSDDLAEKDKATMESILVTNWTAQAPNDTAIIESTKQSLRDSFHNPATQFFILRKHAEIAAFVRFDEQADGSLYAGSLNVNPMFRSSGIGEAMLKHTIDAQAASRNITAHVPPELAVAMKYVNEFGLVITGIDEEVTLEGKAIRDLRLERDDTKNWQYDGQQVVNDNIPSYLRLQQFDLRQGTEPIIRAVAYQTSRGQVGTRYFADPLNPHLRYIAFEPAITEIAQKLAA